MDWRSILRFYAQPLHLYAAGAGGTFAGPAAFFQCSGHRRCLNVMASMWPPAIESTAMQIFLRRPFLGRSVFQCGVALGVLCLGSGQVLASGYALREASAAAMGTAYAGAAASNANAGYLFYNPAAVSGVGDYDLSLNLTGLILGSSGAFAATTAAGTPAGGLTRPQGFIGDALVPAAALRYRLNDRLALGVSFTVPWGEVTHYPDGWVGRYYAASTSLTVFNATPVIGYQITPQLSVAAGAQVQYARSRLTQAIDFGTLGALNGFPGAVPGAMDGMADLGGHSWGAGYVVGAMWSPSPVLDLGLSYRSEVQLVLKGKEHFQYDSAGIAATINALTGAFADSGGRADLPTPASVTAGARWRFADGWTALGGLEYTNWSSLRQLLVLPDNVVNPSSLTVLNWKDTWFGSIGFEFRPDDVWTLRVGTAYDMAGAPPETLEPRIPDADRYWISAGVGYRWTAHLDTNFAVSHIFTPRSTLVQSADMIGNEARGTLAGSSSSDATLIGLEVVLR